MNFLSRNMLVIALALLSNFAQAGVIETGSASALMPPATQAEAAGPQPLTASMVLDLGERIVARTNQVTHQQLVTQGARALTPRPGNVRSALRGISSGQIVLTHSAARR